MTPPSPASDESLSHSFDLILTLMVRTVRKEKDENRVCLDLLLLSFLLLPAIKVLRAGSFSSQFKLEDSSEKMFSAVSTKSTPVTNITFLPSSIMHTAASNQIKANGSNSLRFSIDSILTRKKISSSPAPSSKVKREINGDDDREDEERKSINTVIKKLSKTSSKHQDKHQRSQERLFDNKTKRSPTIDSNEKHEKLDSDDDEEVDVDDCKNNMSDESEGEAGDFEDETSVSGSSGTPGPSTTSHPSNLPMYSQVQMVSSPVTLASLPNHHHHPWPHPLHPHPLMSPLNHAQHPFLGWMRSSQGSPLSPSSLLSEYNYL